MGCGIAWIAWWGQTRARGARLIIYKKMLSKKQLDLQKIVRKVATKPAFMGVCINGNRATASDSAILAEVTNKGGAQIPMGTIFPKSEMILNLTGIKTGVKIQSVPGSENVFFSKEDGETATLFATDKTNKRIYEVTKISDEFPDYSILMAGAAAQPIKMAVSGEELQKVANLLKDYREITIRVSDDVDKVIYFEANDSETQARVILAKLKLSE
jgi:hypothetical protein